MKISQQFAQIDTETSLNCRKLIDSVRARVLVLKMNDIDDGRTNKLRIMRESSPHLGDTRFNQCKCVSKPYTEEENKREKTTDRKE